MRYVRYIIAALLVFITFSIYIRAINDFYNYDIIKFWVSIIPISALDFILIWVYSKGTIIYGTNNKQKGRWLLISFLLITTFISIIYSVIQKIEADNAKMMCIELDVKNEKFKSKLDSCVLNNKTSIKDSL